MFRKAVTLMVLAVAKMAIAVFTLFDDRSLRHASQ
jgi:uncharacterized membrane protein